MSVGNVGERFHFRSLLHLSARQLTGSFFLTQAVPIATHNRIIQVAFSSFADFRGCVEAGNARVISGTHHGGRPRFHPQQSNARGTKFTHAFINGL